MIAQTTIIAGTIVLKIIGLIVFGLGNDYNVRLMTHQDYDIFVVNSAKFHDAKNVSMFILFRAHNGFYDEMIIKNNKKENIFAGRLDFVRVLRYDVLDDHIKEHVVNVNVTSGQIY